MALFLSTPERFNRKDAKGNRKERKEKILCFGSEA
jgi:hypothetical protein